jgi:uncharacterized cupin superfamily protein
MNLRDVVPIPEEGCPAGFAFAEISARERPGDELMGCTLYEFEPGNQLWPYHFHFGNEEWAIIVAGSPTVRTPEGERVLAQGDIVAFPEGEAGAHTFLNRSDAEARIAMFSTLNRSTLPVYPDSGKVAAYRRCFRMADAVDYWDGESPPV